MAKRELYNTFALAILAGIMIGFGGVIYLMCANKRVGALLFSFGLLTIVEGRTTWKPLETII